MKKKSLLIISICLLVLLAVLMTSCMSSTLIEKNVRTRLKDEGYTVKNITSCAITNGWNEPIEEGSNVSRYKIGTQLYCTNDPVEDDEGNVTFQKEVWVVYCMNDDSFKWVEDNAKNLSGQTGYKYYSYNNGDVKVVFYGDMDSVRLARQY